MCFKILPPHLNAYGNRPNSINDVFRNNKKTRRPINYNTLSKNNILNNNMVNSFYRLTVSLNLLQQPNYL